VAAQFERQNHLCSACAEPLDQSGEGVGVDYDKRLRMRSLVHLTCKSEIEAAKDQEWLNSPDANKEREKLINRGFSREKVEHLMEQMLRHGLELWLDEDGNLMEIIGGELIDMHVAGDERPD
jgi:hypothetical protein